MTAARTCSCISPPFRRPAWKAWPTVQILVRGDSGFARPNLMTWCEANPVDYIFGLARNTVLLHKARKVRSRAAVDFMATGETALAFGHFTHKAYSPGSGRLRSGAMQSRSGTHGGVAGAK